MYLALIRMWLAVYHRAGARSIKLTVVSSQFPVPHLRTLPRQTYSLSLLRTARGRYFSIGSLFLLSASHIFRTFAQASVQFETRAAHYDSRFRNVE
jgi:hypothetical protein